MLYALIVVNVVLVLLLIWAVLSLRKVKLENTKLTSRLVEVEQDVSLLYSCADNMGMRMVASEQLVNNIGNEQEQLVRQQPEATPAYNDHYQQAISMVQRGAKDEEVMTICDLTRGEVELLRQLHGG